MDKLKKLKEIWLKRPLLSRLWILGVCLLVMSIEIHQTLKTPMSVAHRKLAAKRDLKPGIVLSVHDITVGLDNSPGGQSSLTFTEQEIDKVIGSRVLADIASGALISKAQVQPKTGPGFSRKVPKGFRAYLIKTKSRLPLETGDRVDLVGKGIESQGKGNILLEDKKVLGLNKKDDYQEILVAVTPNEISQLASFSEDGWMEVILRNPLDETRTPQKKVVSRRKKIHAIQVLEEG